MKKGILTAVAALLMSSQSAMAGQIEDTIKANLAQALGPTIESVSKSSFSELYEVVVPQGIFYTDKTGSFFIANGVAINAKTRENMTDQRWNALGTFDFAKLPLADAIKTVKGDGKRVMATFEDPNCMYCKKLASELDKLDNVTIYTFLYPVLGPESSSKSKAIWCSKDSAETWREFMKGNPDTAGFGAECANPIDRNVELGRKLKIRGTPAVLFASGNRMPGFAPAQRIEEFLQKR